MHYKKTRPILATICLGVLFLAACAAKPALQPKFAGVPPGIDLSGQWQVRDRAGGRQPPGRDAESEPIVQRGLSSKRRARERSKRMTGNAVEVFLENGRALKISQTHFGLFISYDRSVVEEYRFGENRQVTIGPIEAQRVSGWEDRSFVVETLDKDGATLFEVWQLASGGDVLTRNIRISKSAKDLFTAQQTFDRIQN